MDPQFIGPLGSFGNETVQDNRKAAAIIWYRMYPLVIKRVA